MPCALQRTIFQKVALRHRKVLVGTDIAQSGDLAVLPNQTNGVTGRSHPLHYGSFDKLCQRSDSLEGRIFVFSNEWKSARCAHLSVT
jgi:hypothetical protein